MGKVLVIGEEGLFQKLNDLKSSCSLKIEIDHKEKITGNLVNEIKKDGSCTVLIFLDMKVSSDKESPASFIKELGDKKIRVPVYILTDQYDLKEAEDILMEENSIGYTSYKPGDEGVVFSKEIEEEIGKVLQEAEIRASRKSEAGTEDKKPLGWALKVKPEDYEKRRMVNLFIGEMREFILTLKFIINDLNMKMKEVPSRDPFNPIFSVQQIDDWHRWEVLQEAPKEEKERAGKETFEKNRSNYHLFSKAPSKLITPNTILIRGETGTGKSLAVRLIHKYTAGEGKPLREINCTGIPEPLLEGELFGAMAGSYTDRKTTNPGLIIMAYGGTLFLDEIGDMPMALQAKLLKFLDDSKVYPLGWSGEGIYVPLTSVIAATNKDLKEKIEEKEFREDLYYRFSHDIWIPSLKERKWDLEKMIDFVLQNPDVNPVVDKKEGKRHVNFIHQEALSSLKNHEFPGNFRELESILMKAILKARLDWIDTILKEHISFRE